VEPFGVGESVQRRISFLRVVAAPDRFGVVIGAVYGLAFFMGEWLSSQKAVMVRGIAR